MMHGHTNINVLLTGWHRSHVSDFLLFEKQRAALRFIQPCLYKASEDVSKGSESGSAKQTAHRHLVPRLRVRAEGNFMKTNTVFGRFTILFAKRKQMQIFSALFLSAFSSASISARNNFKMDVTSPQNFTSMLRWIWLIQASFSRNTIKIAENLREYLYMIQVVSRG